MDTSKFAPITFTLTVRNRSSVLEGDVSDFVLSGANVLAGTLAQYSLSGISADDIVGGQLSGTTTFGADGIATISVKLAQDNLIEGDETLTLTSQGKSVSVQIVDTGALNSNVTPNTFIGSDAGDFLSRSVWDLADTVFQGRGGDDIIWAGGGRSTVYGGAGNDRINSTRGDQQLFGDNGNDVFSLSSDVTTWSTNVDGGSGVDSIRFYSKLPGIAIGPAIGGVVVLNSSGSQLRLVDIERIITEDYAIALDVSGNAGKAYRVYKAAFARDPMAGDKAGLGYWISNIDKGMDMVEVAARFIDSPEFRGLYGQNPSNADFLTKVYTNVLERTPDQDGYNWWLNELNTNPSKTKAKVLADFAESAENQTGVASLIGNGITYEPWVG